jgi:phenylalanine-4-hydroxylase
MKDKVKFKVLEANDDLISDHPSFSDPEYRKRREEINLLPADIDVIKYKQEEIHTWKTVWENIRALHDKYACITYNENMKDLIENNIIEGDHVPQITKVSNYIENKSGFKLYPVNGLLSPYQYFEGLSKKIFYCTRYVRHHERPFYTSEPDIIHEMLGHAPMFLDPIICEFSEKIGKIAIENKERINIFERLYWNTIEFGIIKQNNDYKVYGAGLLSSVDEMKKVFENNNLLESFDMVKVINEKPLITDLQNHYYYIQNMDELFEMLNMW